MKSNSETNLVWIDLEMTGLDPNTCQILEAALIVTNDQLEILEESPSYLIHQPVEVLEAMSDEVKELHKKSGLLDRLTTATMSVEEVEDNLLSIIQQHVSAGMSPLCGNSIHSDRGFIKKYMPRLNSFLHYRHIDVSTVKELYKRWKPEAIMFEKKGTHAALDDIRESIEELKFYREEFFCLSSSDKER